LPEYTSGIITTYDSFKFTHGYAEIRAKLPQGDGLWPAFWLLNGYYVDQQPEIDVIETRGENPNELVHSYHLSPKDGGPPSYTWSTFSNDPDGFSDDFHTYGIAWEPGKLDWYVDGVKKHTHTGPSVSSQNMYAILNLAVGGNFHFTETDEAQFPISFEIDRIRVYQPVQVPDILPGEGDPVELPDQTDPTGAVTSPIDGSVIEASSSYELEGTYDDDQSGVDWLRVRIQRLGVSPAEYWNGTSWQVGTSWQEADLDEDGNWKLPEVDFSQPGKYRTRLNIRDNAGNIAAPAETPANNIEVISVALPDTTDPTVTAADPAEGAVITPDASVTLRGDYDDDNSGVALVLVRVQRLGTSPAEYWSVGGWVTSSTFTEAVLDGQGEWTLGGVDLSEEGAYRLRFQARDNAGNLATGSELSTVDYEQITSF